MDVNVEFNADNCPDHLESSDEWRVCSQNMKSATRQGASPGTDWIPTESLSTRFLVKGFETSHNNTRGNARHHGKWTLGREQSSYGKDTDRVVA